MEQLSNEEAELLAKLEEIRKKKLELSKPLEATVLAINFTQLQNSFDVKFNKDPDPITLDRIRLIPGRKYIPTRQINQFPVEHFERLKYELNEIDIPLFIPIDIAKKYDEYKTSPDFRLTFNAKRSQIFIHSTIRNSRLPDYNYSISTWTRHYGDNSFSFSVNEILTWMEQQVGEYKRFKFELSPEVETLYQEHLKREQLIEKFAEMKDAPEIDYVFKYQNDKGEEVIYNLKPDQKVACLFDDTFSGRVLLSYDMGKGKTAIAIAQAERNNERVLFVCKADLKTNIRREVAKFTGKSAFVFAGVEPDRLAVDYMLAKKQQYNIINYDIIGRSIKDDPKDKASPEIMKWVELINLSQFDRIIYDEAHYMKNVEAQRSKAGRSLKATKTMLLTGTPIVNRPGELWPILNIIDPNTFPDYAVFRNQFTDFAGNPKNLSQLHKLLKKYMIRRTRDNSYDPNRIPQYHELSSKARAHYNDVLAGLYIALRNPNYQSNVNNILTELLRLKQICADDKVDFTVDLVETALDETEMLPWNKVLVFSQFKATQIEIAHRLGSKAAIINGDVTDKARYELVDKFQDTKSPIKVIITNIVEGLTLTQAGTTINNDLMWTPKDLSQFEGRAFGRENDPHGGNSYIILTEDSVEDLIWGIIEKKARIAKQIVDDVYVKGEQEQSVFKELISLLRGKI